MGPRTHSVSFTVIASVSFAFYCMNIVLMSLPTAVQAVGPYDWQARDAFDEINDRMTAINADNCESKSEAELHLSPDSVAQKPRFNRLLSETIYPNRTNLLHLHNMALSRAFYYSFIFQKLNTSSTFRLQPGLMYYYFSTAADISANEYNINGSSVFFDNNCQYATFYRNLPFNHTLPLFGPRAWRFDDYNDPTNWLREPTNETVDIVDYGAGSQSNYTLQSYKLNDWYNFFLPDVTNTGQFDARKHTYTVGIKYSNATGSFRDDEFQATSFFGPPSPGQKDLDDSRLPVRWTRPYFDCGRSNKWIVSAVAPVIDQLPRYLEWIHLRRHRFVGVTTQDIDFLSIDINPCPISDGNPAPNLFAGTARCKPSTMCEPLYGWGFRRGGYQCMCRPGYRYPPWQRGPFQGGDIESATQQEYNEGFNCLRVELMQVIPLKDQNRTFSIGKRSVRGHDMLVDSVRDVLKSERRHALPPKRRLADPPSTQRPPVPAAQTAPPAQPPSQPPTALPHTQPRRSHILSKKQRFYRMMKFREIQLGERKVLVTRELADELLKFTPTAARVTRLTPRYKRSATAADSAGTEPKLTRHKRAALNRRSRTRMEDILFQKERINKANCATFRAEELQLPGDVAYGVEKQFSSQARLALRLSHFLSNFLQNVDIYEEYGNLRGDRLLNEEQLFGEVLANVMGDLKLKGSGIFYDVDMFKMPNGATKQFFGPYAYRFQSDSQNNNPQPDIATTVFRAVDYAGFPRTYLDYPWFKNVKERWQSNTYGLTKFTEKPMIRSDIAGTSLRRFELYPLYYRAPQESDGWWSAPYFDCNGHVNDWIITYSVPFFGLNSIGTAIEFKGVVTADIRLDELDINQCPMDFYVPNAFKNTALCHYDSTYCVHIPGKSFSRGWYKCECRQGYEYTIDKWAWYYDGQELETEHRKMMLGRPNTFETLRCRIAGASQLTTSLFSIVSSFIFLYSAL